VIADIYDTTMDILVFLIFTALPSLISAYLSYMFATVKGFPKLPLVGLSLIFGAIVPLLIFLVRPRENVNHPLYPGAVSEIFMKAPAAIRRRPEISTVDEPGYLYLAHDKLLWVPKANTSGYSWNYEYGLPLGESRIYKSGTLSWMLLPTGSGEPVALTLGGRSSFAKLHIATSLNAVKNGDEEIIEKLREGKNFWNFGQSQKGDNNE
jgi:hypothetical protein